jgi:CRP-like cAMP-binding protein
MGDKETRMDLVDLKRLRLFRTLTESELRKIGERLSCVEMPKGVRVLEAGEPAQTLYIIHSGSVKVKTRLGRHVITLATMGAYEHFGDMALIDGQGSSADVETDEPSVFWLLHRHDFMHLIEDDHDIGRKLWRTLAEILTERLRRTTKTLYDYQRLQQDKMDNETFREFYKLCHT